ncbi:MAG: hypothetical protein Q8O22_03325 [Candidatus Omnitrophota bacterium]|nr:hypothetical protein [Candidatus Omnitrophota bacterium]
MVLNPRKCSYKVWEEKNYVKGEVRLIRFDYRTIFNFRDILIRSIQEGKNFCLLKRENRPTELDSEYLLFAKDIFEAVQSQIKNYDEGAKNHPTIPNPLSAILNTKTYKQFNEWAVKRDEEWKNNVLDLSSFVVETSHDYPYVECSSRIHSKEQLITELQKIAQELNIELECLV